MDELQDISFIMIDEMLNDTASYACPECGIVTQCYTDCPLQVKGN
jgi:lipopolysaccharide biosynthesis regulator YciM